MYDFKYVNSDTRAEKDYFTDTKTFVANCNRMSTPGPVPKHCLGFSYVREEYYELDLNFDET